MGSSNLPYTPHIHVYFLLMNHNTVPVASVVFSLLYLFHLPIHQPTHQPIVFCCLLFEWIHRASAMGAAASIFLGSISILCVPSSMKVPPLAIGHAPSPPSLSPAAGKLSLLLADAALDKWASSPCGLWIQPMIECIVMNLIGDITLLYCI